MDDTQDDLVSINVSTITPDISATWDANYSPILSDLTISSNNYSWSNTSLAPNIAAPNIYISDSIWSTTPSSTLSIKGDDADIDINGVSLMETIRGIQDRLNILCPDPEMEQEWDELRELRQQYESKLVECKEKSRVWKALKQQG